MQIFIDTIMSGVVATIAMTAFLWIIHYTKLVTADMPRAIGGLFTKSADNALVIGIVIHFLSGIIIAFIYIAIWSMFRFDPGILVIAGAVMGTGHGLVVSFALIIAVAERHPLEQFREAGFEVAVAHLVAHVIYGVVLAAMAASTGVRFSIMQG